MKKILFVFITVLGVTAGSAQTKAAGVTLPATLNYSGQEMILNGVGVREKFWMDMYAGALYLNKKSNNANAILNSNDPMAIRLHIISKLISSDKMVDAVNEGFNNTTGGNTAALKPKIEEFKSFFGEEIKKNDKFDIVNLPSEGVVVYKNGKKLGAIKGNDFRKALFGIWLSDKPADSDLRKAMLGK